MTRITFAAVALCGLVLGTAALAQTRGGTGGTPGFTGEWTLVPPPAGAAAGGRGRGGGGLGPEITIKQDGATLVLTRPAAAGGGPAVAMYKLDGSESRNVVAGRGGQSEQVSKAMWDGNKLAITATLETPNGPVEQKRVFSMEGDNLVIETTQAGAGTTRAVYRKK